MLILTGASHASVQRVQRAQRVQEMEYFAQVRSCFDRQFIVVSTREFFLNTDIDECSEGIDDCDINSDCADTDGSFTCTCREGYLGNGTFCSSKILFIQCHTWYSVVMEKCFGQYCTFWQLTQSTV